MLNFGEKKQAQYAYAYKRYAYKKKTCIGEAIKNINGTCQYVLHLKIEKSECHGTEFRTIDRDQRTIKGKKMTTRNAEFNR